MIFKNIRIMLQNFLPIIIMGKEKKNMLAMLWCQEIILGNRTFDEVPAKLKDKVAQLLINSGCGDLVTK